MSVTLPAPAKINIGLQVVGRRDDGYHLLHTLFQVLDWGDTITLEPRETGVTLEVTGPHSSAIPTNETNLAVKAAQILQKEMDTNRGIHIVLDKQIPPGSGLGGGSSDAATVLKGLNRLWGAGLSDDLLELVAARLGADVPLFIRGGLQLGESIGDRLTPLSSRLVGAIVLAIPDIHISTPWAFSQLAKSGGYSSPVSLDRLIAMSSIPWDDFVNDFEPVVFAAHPELRAIKEGLLELGAVYASLSGSGGTVFGFFEEEPAPLSSLKSFFGPHQVIRTKAAF